MRCFIIFVFTLASFESISSTTIYSKENIDLDSINHGGGLDQNGCHRDRKRGGYHCHRP